MPALSMLFIFFRQEKNVSPAFLWVGGGTKFSRLSFLRSSFITDMILDFLTPVSAWGSPFFFMPLYVSQDTWIVSRFSTKSVVGEGNFLERCYRMTHPKTTSFFPHKNEKEFFSVRTFSLCCIHPRIENRNSR